MFPEMRCWGLQDRCHRLGQTKAVTVYRLVRPASALILGMIRLD